MFVFSVEKKSKKIKTNIANEQRICIKSCVESEIKRRVRTTHISFDAYKKQNRDEFIFKQSWYFFFKKTPFVNELKKIKTIGFQIKKINK